MSGLAAEPVEAVLEAAGALAVTLSDGGEQQLIEPEPGAAVLWQDTRVTGLFAPETDPDPIIAALQRELNLARPPRWHARLVEDRDWVRAWLDDYRAMRFGERLWVCPHHDSVDADDAVVVRLDPGLAFGTGAHASTALCLQWLAHNPPTGQLVVDYGCGSGILAIAAARLGARRVLAVDTDPQALIATRDNAAHNNVADRVHTVTPDALPPQACDLVLANILAGPLIELAPALTGLLADSGQLVLAGLLADQADSVMQAYAGLRFSPPVEDSGWARLDARRA